MNKKITLKEKQLISKLITSIKNNVNVVNEYNLLELDRISYMHTPDVKNEYYFLDGYVRTCIQFKRLPKMIGKGILDCFKGSPYMMLVIDEDHISNDEIVTFMGKKVDHLVNDSSDASKDNEIRNATDEIETQESFNDRIFNTGETCKFVTIRLYLKHENLDELKKLVVWVNKRMKKYNLCGCIQRNMLPADLKAQTMLSNPSRTIVTTKGLTNMLMSDDVVEVKPLAFPLGSTDCGAYCPDYLSYAYRSFCIGIVGKQGSGKSALIKKIVKHALLRDEQVIIFDMHNEEYKRLADLFHIPSISLSMRDTINHYQIFKNDDKNGKVMSELTISEQISLDSATFCKFTGLEKKDDKVTFYTNVLAEMYAKYLDESVESFSDDDWFVVSDVIAHITKHQDEYTKEVPLEVVNSLKQNLVNMQRQYGFFFDKKTNVNLDLNKSFRIDMSFLEEFETNELKNSYVGLMFSFLGKILRQNERINQDIINEKGQNELFRPPHPLLVILEESGTFLKDTEIKRRVDVMMRQTRKGCAQFIFAFHTIADISGGNKEDADLLKSIFALCACIILGLIDTNTKNELPNYIENVTIEDTSTAEKFIVNGDDKEKRRQFLACTDDGKKVHFSTKILPSEYLLFGGGK